MNIPCQVDPERWVSDEKVLRDASVKGCAPCPMKQQCLEDAAGRGERWGVWGGFDFTHLRNANVVPKPCEHCGALFGARATESGYDFRARRFCSRRCANTFSNHARRDAKRAAA